MAKRPPAPAFVEGDVVRYRSSMSGRAEVREVLFVNGTAKHGGARWRVRLAYPVKGANDGPAGRVVEQFVDAARLERVQQEGLF